MVIDVIDAYLTRQRSLGMRFEVRRRVAPSLRPGNGERPIQEVTAGAILDFLNGNGALTATWTLKHRVLTGLYRFAVSRGYVDNSPLPTTLPRLPPQQTPYVYSTDELRRLLDSDSDPAHGPQSSSPRHVPHAAVAPVRNRHAYRRGLALDLAGRRPRKGSSPSAARNFSRRVCFRSTKLADELAAHLERRGLLPMCASGERRRSSHRTAFEDGALRVIATSSTCDELPASTVPSANRGRRACMIFATPRPCIVSSRGIEPARTSSDCFRSSLPTSVTSISDQPSVTSK